MCLDAEEIKENRYSHRKNNLLKNNKVKSLKKNKVS